MIRYLPAGVAYAAAPFLVAATRPVSAWGPVLVALLVLIATGWALLDH